MTNKIKHPLGTEVNFKLQPSLRLSTHTFYHEKCPATDQVVTATLARDGETLTVTIFDARYKVHRRKISRAS